MSNKALPIVAAALVWSGFCANGQGLSHRIDFPKDAPVSLQSADFGNSNATARGANVIEVNAALSLRNSGQKRIRSMTLMVYAPDSASGGKGSVAVPTLDVAPGETFSIRIDTRLLRPLAAGNPVVEVKLDGILFDDLSFYGPDTLHSQRTMTIWELEAQRDRKYFKTLLETAGGEGLRKEMLSSLARQGDRSQPGVQMVRSRATNIDAEPEAQFAFLAIPESPVEASGGMARIGSSLAGAPRFEVRNRSNRPVQHLEIGWIVKDQQGREFLAASVPADMKLAPNQSGQVAQDAALRFDRPISIQSMSGFVSSVEFADGSQWIPTRSALDQLRLRQVVAPSPEEQRLSQIYNKKGLQALIAELKKF
ncbi:MAG: hypothetical protein JWO19_4051 [Bryobacterales bacterium]|jgi:hypothetical protein|nr:hypothetical protein [Bryobacterales bacterium]